MNLRKTLYFGYHTARGGALPRLYRQMRADDEKGAGSDRQVELLDRMLQHARQFVPYYAHVIPARAAGADPRDVLRQMPLLTKPVIREHFDRLRAMDGRRRKVFVNASGGSTGEPVRVLQDAEYEAATVAIRAVHSGWVGHEIGRREVLLWGSERDVLAGRESPRNIVGNWLTRREVVNAYRLTPADMAKFVQTLNTHPPSLIIAYAQALYELAGFVEQEGLMVVPQRPIVTTSETLYGFMRSRIERVFQAAVLNRYGCRELGDIAGQCPARLGLHVFPWGNFVEIVDNDGRPVPDGTEGELVVTSLVNFAMPMIRYRIGDRGVLAPPGIGCTCGRGGQVLRAVTGRSSDVFRRRDGTLVDPGYFMGLLEFKSWIRKFQVVQLDYDRVLFRIEESGERQLGEIEELTRQAKAAMGSNCVVDFEFLDHIGLSPSGKFRYTMSEVAPPAAAQRR